MRKILFIVLAAIVMAAPQGFAQSPDAESIIEPMSKEGMQLFVKKLNEWYSMANDPASRAILQASYDLDLGEVEVWDGKVNLDVDAVNQNVIQYLQEAEFLTDEVKDKWEESMERANQEEKAYGAGNLLLQSGEFNSDDWGTPLGSFKIKEKNGVQIDAKNESAVLRLNVQSLNITQPMNGTLVLNVVLDGDQLKLKSSAYKQ